jgi:hypothetical protein
MSKFKVGDRVEVRDYPAESWLGRGVVDYVDHDCVIVNFDDGRRGGFDHEYVFSDIASPIRTVTRREIVPGSYGAVDVDDEFARAVVWMYGDNAADKFREAAHLFNQLAEVLEENSKAAA